MYVVLAARRESRSEAALRDGAARVAGGEAAEEAQRRGGLAWLGLGLGVGLGLGLGFGFGFGFGFGPGLWADGSPAALHAAIAEANACGLPRSAALAW